MLHGRPLRTNLPSPRPAAQSDNTLEAQSCRHQSYAQATSSYTTTHHYEKGKVLPCIITIHIHGSPLPLPKCCRPPGLISYQQMTVVFIVETGVMIRAPPSTTPNHVTSPQKLNCAIPNPSVSPTLPGCNSSGSNVTQPQNGSTHDGQYVTRYGRISKPTSRY